MAFEKIDVSSLRTALYDCKSEINHHITDQLITDFASNNWISDTKKNLKKALQNLVDVRYKDLTIKIEQYLKVTDMIEQYQKLQAENEDMEDKIDGLTPKLKKTVYYDEYYTDDKGKEICETKSKEVVDTDIQDKIDDLNDKIDDHKAEMKMLKSKIGNAI